MPIFVKIRPCGLPIAWWTVTDKEAAGLRAYLQKGGFLFIDDFKPAGWRGPGGGWEPFAKTMRRVLPDVQRPAAVRPDQRSVQTLLEASLAGIVGTLSDPAVARA
jgi:hypothetical protein